MKTPYQILGVAPEATDAEIKQAYLQKVKENPPDRDQKQFQLMHDAYLTIKDAKCRLNYDLFTFPVANFDDVIDKALHSENQPTLTAKQFNALLAASVDESTTKHAIPMADK
jgi:curved DNA-binding protein CbpA